MGRSFKINRKLITSRKRLPKRSATSPIATEKSAKLSRNSPISTEIFPQITANSSINYMKSLKELSLVCFIATLGKLNTTSRNEPCNKTSDVQSLKSQSLNAAKLLICPTRHTYTPTAGQPTSARHTTRSKNQLNHTPTLSLIRPAKLKLINSITPIVNYFDKMGNCLLYTSDAADE